MFLTVCSPRNSYPSGSFPVGRAREADAAALGQALQAGGDVDAVSVEALALDDDIAQIDPDSEPHLAGGRQVGVPGLEGALDLDGALDSVHDAGELRQHVVAGGVHDAPAMAGHRGGDHRAGLGDGADGRHLVVAHEPAIPLHIGAHDGGELPLHGTRIHGTEFYPRPRRTLRPARHYG